MPLVRISHAAGKSADQVAALSQGVQQALIGAFAVPRDDYFQIVTEHPARVGIVGPVEFLGITHSADMVVVQVTCAEGRTLEQKKALYAAIAQNFQQGAGVRAEDVIINLVETKRENWSFGNGIAQYAPQ